MLILASLLLSAHAHAVTPDQSVSADVDAALANNQSSLDYESWKNSGLTPEDVFERVEAKNSPEARQELCVKLASLSDENLAFFDHELSHAREAALLECRASLQARLARYWARMKHALAVNHDGQADADAPAGFLAADAPAADDVETAAPKLPNEVRVVDAARGPVYTDGHLAHGEIALTFDDGPHPTRTQKILETLRRSGIRATFFEVGEMAKRNPQLSKAEIAAGHTVGSHTWSHPNLPKLSLRDAEHNILFGHDAVMTATGVETPFFRFPYGARNSTLTAFVQSLHMASFLWNLDSLDWKLRDPRVLFANVLKELNREKGGIILFHDIQEQTTIVLPHFLEELHNRGFKTIVFVPQPPPPPQQP